MSDESLFEGTEKEIGKDYGTKGEPNPAVPIQNLKMAICLHCRKPIMLVPGIDDWSHGHNGNIYCDAPSPSAEDVELAQRIIRGEQTDKSIEELMGGEQVD